MQESFTVKLNSIKIPKILSLLPLALLIGSCGANFENLEKFGLTSAVIQDSSAKMAEDIYQSCLRQAKYIPFGGLSEAIEKREEEEKNCAQELPSVEAVTNANLVLISYVRAIGQLASNDTVSFEKDLDALENSFKNLNTTSIALKEDQVSAGLKIARFIFNEFIAQFQRENLQDAILCTNQPIQEYVPGLVSIVEKFYIDGILQIERLNIDRYYQKFTPTSEQSSQLLALFTLEQSYIKEVDALNKRKEAADAYIEILKQTAQTHQKLKNEFNQPIRTEKEIEDLCQKYFSENGDTQPSQTSLPSPKQLKRINEIVMEYQNEITPLVQKLEGAFEIMLFG